MEKEEASLTTSQLRTLLGDTRYPSEIAQHTDQPKNGQKTQNKENQKIEKNNQKNDTKTKKSTPIITADTEEPSKPIKPLSKPPKTPKIELADFDVHPSHLTSRTKFSSIQLHALATTNPNTYHNESLVQKCAYESNYLFGATKTIFVVLLREYCKQLKLMIYAKHFSMDSFLASFYEWIFAKIPEFVEIEKFENFTNSLKSIITSLGVEMRCLVVDITQYWLSFFFKEFWVFVEIGVIQFYDFSFFVKRSFMEGYLRYKTLAVMMEGTWFRGLVEQWMDEIYDSVRRFRANDMFKGV